MRKQQSRRGNSCKVTFELPPETGATEVHLCGDFNESSPTATPMKRRKDGSFHATLTLEAGRRYRFRYLLGDGKWENDWAADDYAPNEFGGEDSVVET
jgi:1,4-alpha-glucan branching enzyme